MDAAPPVASKSINSRATKMPPAKKAHDLTTLLEVKSKKVSWMTSTHGAFHRAVYSPHKGIVVDVLHHTKDSVVALRRHDGDDVDKVLGAGLGE